MKIIATALIVATAALPVAAQEEDSLMKRGLRLFMEGLMEEMEPTLRDFGELAENAAPFLQEMQRSLGEVVEDFDAYHAPEILPNGDIVIRRKTPLTDPLPPTEPALPPIDDRGIDL
ncbi:hypothetical protein [Jannaschia donghaensis]|uniref:AAA+ family ATPase n=1 Tax=Jannaschia donghaensis TaxID=420998 RepID=A0A0M6YLH2_9RHOB|nr:hypothetical protein [Jannaschia donghaensis]CTQ49906.1 hypothetical protein JDO7802_01923 [Jannaschia donghaensis]